MIKLFESGLTDPFFFSLNIDSTNLVKTANEKDLPSEVDEAIKSLDRRPNHKYALISAMGAGEIWGSNRNADYFREAALTGTQKPHEKINKTIGPRPRYKTFEDGHFFHHHRNKPERGDAIYGYVPASIWNPKMRTVLLIIGVDASKDPETAEQIEKDMITSFSMGGRLPWDECSICKNRATKRSEYCEHLRRSPNQILPDGRKVFAYNEEPAFFDISKVFRPAFEGGRHLMKVASDELSSVLSADLADEYRVADPFAYQGQEVHHDWDVSEKINEITSRFPGHLIDAVNKVSERENFISPSILSSVCKYEFQTIWGGFAIAGIVPTPSEFAYIYLMKSGRPDLAAKFIHKKVKFSRRTSTDDIDPYLFKTVGVDTTGEAKDVAGKFSSEVIQNRSISTLSDRMYSAYRSQEYVQENGVAELGRILTALYFELRENLANHLLSHEKTALKAADIILPGAAAVSPYIYAAHIQNKQMMGEDPGIIGSTVANHAGKIALVGGLTAAFPHQMKNLGKALIGKK